MLLHLEFRILHRTSGLGFCIENHTVHILPLSPLLPWSCLQRLSQLMVRPALEMLPWHYPPRGVLL